MKSTASGQLQGAGSQRARAGGMPLGLRHVPPQLDDEPAYRDDPIMTWTHKPESPPQLRLGNRPWPSPGKDATPRQSS